MNQNQSFQEMVSGFNTPTAGQMVGLDPAIIQDIVSKHREQVHLTQQMFETINKNAMDKVHTELLKAQTEQTTAQTARMPTPAELARERSIDEKYKTALTEDAQARAISEGKIKPGTVRKYNKTDPKTGEEREVTEQFSNGKWNLIGDVGRIEDTPVKSKMLKWINPKTNEIVQALKQPGNEWNLAPERVEQVPPREKAFETAKGKQEADIGTAEYKKNLMKTTLTGPVDSVKYTRDQAFALDANKRMYSQFYADMKEFYPDCKISVTPDGRKAAVYITGKDGKPKILKWMMLNVPERRPE